MVTKQAVAKQATQAPTQAMRTVASVATVAFAALWANKRLGAMALYNAVCIALGSKPGPYNAVAGKAAAAIAVQAGIATVKATIASRQQSNPNAAKVNGCMPLAETKASGVPGYFTGWVRLAFNGNTSSKGVAAQKAWGTQQSTINSLLPIAYKVIAMHGAAYLPASAMATVKAKLPSK